ncbi:wax ester/triacylglycerol synthase domain-containing protein [Streptomyces sp. YS-3]|uniref:wax ester/triacylglycerol synthase domain-containing protein n=1 Tax=Streptomyces sp. YS-3 TaxID=3381352 RepID=UPI003862810A
MVAKTMNVESALAPTDELSCSRRGVPSTIALAALFAGEPPDQESLYDRVAQRWGRLPRLRQVLSSPERLGWLRRHHWQRADCLDPRRHILSVDCAKDPLRLTALLRELITRPFPEGLPPWQLRVVRQVDDSHFALVLTAHHALLDGQSLLHLATRLLDGDGCVFDGDGEASGAPRRVPLSAERAQQPSTDSTRQSTGLRLGRTLPVNLGSAPQPDLAWAEIDAEMIRSARRALPGLGATLNEVLLAGVSGTLRHVHGEPDRWPGAPRPLYGCFPVDLRTRQEAEVLGNMVSLVRFPLPVDTSDPRERLTACQGVLGKYKPEAAAQGIDAAAKLGPWALRAIAAWGNRPGALPVSCPAFRWPRGTWSLDGRPLTSVIPCPVMPPPGGIAVSLMNCSGTFTLCTISNTVSGHARALTDSFPRELESLAGIERAK